MVKALWLLFDLRAAQHPVAVFALGFLLGFVVGTVLFPWTFSLVDILGGGFD